MKMAKIKSKRGFAILIILAVIATTSVVLATQLASVENQQMTAIRAAQELKARALAEGCLGAADAYVRDFALADVGVDFDALLDPDDNLATTDDNLLPPDTLLDNLVGTASIPPGVADQFHHFKVYRITGVGACFVRFDDNSDDSNTLEALDRFTDAGEGTGDDLPQRDRDRSMSVTVVGVVPDRADIDDLYPRAHAVASITVLRALPPVIAQGAAIRAGEDADLDGAVCGSQAGLIADSISGGVCVCGTLDAEGIVGTDVLQPPGGDCDDCDDCAPTGGSNTAAGPRADPDVVVPPFAGFLANESFGVPGSTGNVIGNSGSCKIYFRDDDAPGSSLPGGSNDIEVFLWDSFDADANATLNAKFAGNADDVPVDDCTAIAPDPVPRPCEWEYGAGASAGIPNGVDCDGGESGCWKLIARLGDGAGKADFDAQTAGNQAEHSSTAGGGSAGNHYMALGSIPNIAIATKTWANYCGGCTNCAASPENTVDIINGDDIHVGPITTANFPSPAIVILHTRAPDAATDTTLFGATTADSILDMGTTVGAKLSILTNSGVAMTASGQGPKICCPTCDCPTLAAVGGNVCGPESANVIAMTAEGFAIRAEGNCDFGGKANAIVGRIDCQTINSDNGDCFIGDMVSHEPEAGPYDCPMGGVPSTVFCETSSGICFKNSANLRGNVYAHSNICSNNNLSLTGSIQSEDNIGWKNNGALNGQVIAEEDVGAKNNNEIEFDGLGGSSAAQGIPASLWMDGNW